MGDLPSPGLTSPMEYNIDDDGNSGFNLRITAKSDQGGRPYMEDMYAVTFQLPDNENQVRYSFFGIFDGHGGKQAALYAQENLLKNIVAHKNFWSEEDELVFKAIRHGFVKTHHGMWKVHADWPKSSNGLPSTSGTTASIGIIRGRKMYIGHVGDTAIVLGRGDTLSNTWSATPLTQDHKPESEVEHARITKSGGKVMFSSGVARVAWKRPLPSHKGPILRSTVMQEVPFLNMTRSLGDLWSYNSEQDKYIVSPEPDISMIELDPKLHRCLIFATDGVWNMMNHVEVVNNVNSSETHNQLELAISPAGTPSSEINDWINPSKRLVNVALEKWQYVHRADNITALTIMIDPSHLKKQKGPRRNQSRAVPVPVRSISCMPYPSSFKIAPKRILTPSTIEQNEWNSPKLPKQQKLVEVKGKLNGTRIPAEIFEPISGRSDSFCISNEPSQHLRLPRGRPKKGIGASKSTKITLRSKSVAPTWKASSPKKSLGQNQVSSVIVTQGSKTSRTKLTMDVSRRSLRSASRTPAQLQLQ